MITVPDTVLNDVAALPGGTAWAGGQTPARRESVYQLSGGQWHAVAVSGPPGAFIATVSATSPANIWFSNNADQVGRRSGSSWVITSFGPAPAVQLDGVVTPGPHDTWAFTYNPMTAQALAHHYNGTSWQATTLPAAVGSFTFTGMESASSSSNIWTWAYGIPPAYMRSGSTGGVAITGWGALPPDTPVALPLEGHAPRRTTSTSLPIPPQSS